MWSMFHLSTQSGAEEASVTRQLFESTGRLLIITCSVLYLIWHLAATVIWPLELGMLVWAVSAPAFPLCALALWLLPRNALLSQAVWQLGLAGLIVLALVLFGRPEVAFTLSLLPLMAVVTIGWRGGALAGAGVLVLVLVLWLGPVGLPATYASAVIAASIVTGLLGWVSTEALTTVAAWSLESYAEAQKYVEEVQQHRARLAVMLKDLDQAYYRLERANAALVGARKVAEEAERFKAEFVANVSHELRTPLNLIVGFSEVIITSPESYGVALPGVYRSDLNAIYRSAQHLLSLVDDVLDLARIEAGKIALVREDVALVELLGEAADTMRDYIAAKGLELRVQIAPGLPFLRIDRVRIRQVLLNLLVNAARFTDRGRITLDARLADDDEVMIRVEDTGRGIPAADVPKVFEEFRSTEQPVSTWHSGTGLGLPISKKFVELHRGRMGVESVFGKGTTFWLTLPCQSGVAEQSSGATSRWAPLVQLRSTERLVVVAHDDPHIAALLQRHLENYRVASVASLDQGLELASDLKAIAVITNQSLPPEASAGETPMVQTPIIRCPLPSSHHAALALGAIDMLTKPVSREDLIDVVRRIERPIRRVLIADDEPRVVRLFERMLRSFLSAATYVEAYDGAEALDGIRTNPPDLVLLDLNMPVLDGHGVLEAMGSDPALAEIPVIVISGQGTDYLNTVLHGPIELIQPNGFHLSQMLQIHESLFHVLASEWRQLDSTAPGRAVAPPE